MFFPLSIVTLMLALVALGTPVKRDSQTVVSDIENLTTKTEALDGAINELPDGGSYVQAMFIHEAALDCESLANTATADTDESPMFTDDQANSINNALGFFVPIVQDVSSALIEKKSAIIASDALLLAQDDIKTLYSDAQEFWSALWAKCPESAKSQMMTYINEVKAAFNTAMAAYDVQPM